MGGDFENKTAKKHENPRTEQSIYFPWFIRHEFIYESLLCRFAAGPLFNQHEMDVTSARHN